MPDFDTVVVAFVVMFTAGGIAMHHYWDKIRIDSPGNVLAATFAVTTVLLPLPILFWTFSLLERLQRVTANYRSLSEVYTRDIGDHKQRLLRAEMDAVSARRELMEMRVLAQ